MDERRRENTPEEGSVGDGTAQDGTTTDATTGGYASGSSLLSRAPLPAPAVSFLARLTATQDKYDWALDQVEKYPQLLDSVKEDFWDQSGRQIDASDGWQVVWFFSQRPLAQFARNLFDSDQSGKRQRIIVIDMSNSWQKENGR